MRSHVAVTVVIALIAGYFVVADQTAIIQSSSGGQRGKDVVVDSAAGNTAAGVDGQPPHQQLDVALGDSTHEGGANFVELPDRNLHEGEQISNESESTGGQSRVQPETTGKLDGKHSALPSTDSFSDHPQTLVTVDFGKQKQDDFQMDKEFLRELFVKPPNSDIGRSEDDSRKVALNNRRRRHTAIDKRLTRSPAAAADAAVATNREIRAGRRLYENVNVSEMRRLRQDMAAEHRRRWRREAESKNEAQDDDDDDDDVYFIIKKSAQSSAAKARRFRRNADLSAATLDDASKAKRVAPAADEEVKAKKAEAEAAAVAEETSEEKEKTQEKIDEDWSKKRSQDDKSTQLRQAKRYYDDYGHEDEEQAEDKEKRDYYDYTEEKEENDEDNKEKRDYDDDDYKGDEEQEEEELTGEAADRSRRYYDDYDKAEQNQEQQRRRRYFDDDADTSRSKQLTKRYYDDDDDYDKREDEQRTERDYYDDYGAEEADEQQEEQEQEEEEEEEDIQDKREDADEFDSKNKRLVADEAAAALQAAKRENMQHAEAAADKTAAERSVVQAAADLQSAAAANVVDKRSEKDKTVQQQQQLEAAVAVKERAAKTREYAVRRARRDAGNRADAASNLYASFGANVDVRKTMTKMRDDDVEDLAEINLSKMSERYQFEKDDEAVQKNVASRENKRAAGGRHARHTFMAGTSQRKEASAVSKRDQAEPPPEDTISQEGLDFLLGRLRGKPAEVSYSVCLLSLIITVDVVAST
jgi:hypothetical protein